MTDASSPLLKPAVIFLGAGVGGVLRYAISSWVPTLIAPSFPLGTLIVNITGCLAIGILATTLGGHAPGREALRAALIIGLLGGYTTFSSFGKETFDLARDSRWLAAGMNVLLSNTLGLAAVWAGAAIGARMHAPAAP